MRPAQNHLTELKALFEMYIDEQRFSACLRPETTSGYTKFFHLFLRIMPEVTSLDLLTEDMLTEYFKRIQTRQRIIGKRTVKTGVKKSTIKTHWSKLNVFFSWLFRKGFIDENPLQDIKPPRVVYDDHRKLNDTELHRIYSAVSRISKNELLQRRDTMMISLLLFTGVRKGEFISLQVRDIDLVKKEITVRAETSKSKKERVLKIHPTLLMHVKDYLSVRNGLDLKTQHLIVSNKGDHGLSREGLKHWVKNLIVKSGVKFHLHRFRHTFACKLAEADVSVFKMQKMMGHSDVTMTMRYTRSMKTEDMADDIGKISI